MNTSELRRDIVAAMAMLAAVSVGSVVVHWLL
jgi:hypothetical protein